MEKGDKVIDKENPEKEIVVHEVTDKNADEFIIMYDFNGKPVTVHDRNENYPKDDRVIKVKYQNSEKKYSFPESRLRHDK